MPPGFPAHDVQFRVLEVNGEPPPAALRGLKDTVFLPNGTTTQPALRFTEPADPDMPYMPYMDHCRLLHHEGEAMMGQFVVVVDEAAEKEKGEDRRTEAASGRSGHGHGRAGRRKGTVRVTNLAS